MSTRRTRIVAIYDPDDGCPAGTPEEVLDYHGMEADWEHRMSGEPGTFNVFCLDDEQAGMLAAGRVMLADRELAVEILDHLPIAGPMSRPTMEEIKDVLLDARMALSDAAKQVGEATNAGLDIEDGYWDEGGEGYAAYKRVEELERRLKGRS